MGEIGSYEVGHANAQVGDRFSFGRYPQGPNGEVEPITWRVLRRDSDSLLVISEKGLDTKPYNEKFCDVTWADCTLRLWLNKEFFDKAFSKREQSLIMASRLTNDVGPDTEDRFFLLSVDEVKSLFADILDRKANPTEYAVKDYAWRGYSKSYSHYGDRDNAVWWWLRSRGNLSGSAAYVYDSGGIGIFGFYVCDNEGLVRPAFRLAIPSTIKAVENDAGLASKTAEGCSGSTVKAAEKCGALVHVGDYASAQVGELLTFGRYPQGPNGEVEPITWRVLRRDSDSLLVISEKGLDAKPYNEKFCGVAWADCTLRYWLNEEFFNNAFNEKEQSLIKTKKILNNSGPSTEDRIFLLSTYEAFIFFADCKAREAKLTEYAIKNHAYTPSDGPYAGNAWWWLRSCGDCSGSAAYVIFHGVIYNEDVCTNDGAVRPAFQLTFVAQEHEVVEDHVNSGSEVAGGYEGPSHAVVEGSENDTNEYLLIKARRVIDGYLGCKWKGDRFSLGRYPQGPNGEVEPITWRVLERDSDSLLVISEKCLDTKPYNDKPGNMTWAGCALRRWLNEEFVKEAFSKREQSLIKTSHLKNNAGQPTEDHVFLLSVDEVGSLFDSDSDLEIKSTAYAIKNGAHILKGNAWWWLRSRGNRSDCAAYVGCYGIINSTTGSKVNSAGGSVCPALRFAISLTPGAAEDDISLVHEVMEDNGELSLDVVQAYRNAQVGDRFEFGHYPQGANGEVEPITWRVLRRDSDGLLVISEQGLDCKKYNEEYIDITWADCDLRRWLNGEFFNKAFSSEEQSLIKTVNISNNVGPSTDDRIFLLSVDEAEGLFANDKDRGVKPTAYAIKNGAWIKDDGAYAGNAWWWLRSRGDCSNDAAYVDRGGYISIYGSVHGDGGSVRPVCLLAI
ncbi:MAG: DUF6273 domain-containing protein [bacterium]|nr:DUF6273 domain-containing protein [bacterium]